MGPSGTDSALDGEADGRRDPQTERTLTILQIKKLGREIDCEGIHAALLRRRRRQEEEGKIWGSLKMARQFGGWIMTSVSEGVNPIVLGGRERLREGEGGWHCAIST